MRKYLNQTFQSIFSEYPTAQKFQLEPDKLKYVFNWGLPPHFKDLKTKLQNSEFLVTSFDESQKVNSELPNGYWNLFLESRSNTGQSKILGLPIPSTRY